MIQEHVREQIYNRLQSLIRAHLNSGDPKPVLAIWFKRQDSREIHLMEAMESQIHRAEVAQLPPQELRHSAQDMGWRLSAQLHHVIVYSPRTTLERMIAFNDQWIREFSTDSETLYFDPEALCPAILDAFRIRVEPNNFLKGWYLDAAQVKELAESPGKIQQWSSSRPTIGMMQTSESSDFARKVGIMHVEIENQWIPMGPSAVTSYTWYGDWLQRKPGALLFRGGTIFRIEGFEVKTLANISRDVVKPTPRNEYVEAHLSKMPLDR